MGNVSAQPGPMQVNVKGKRQIAVSVSTLLDIGRLLTSQDLAEVLVELEPVGQQAKEEQEHGEPEEHEP